MSGECGHVAVCRWGVYGGCAPASLGKEGAQKRIGSYGECCLGETLGPSEMKEEVPVPYSGH